VSVTLRVCGAARTVTGSCHLFEVGGRRILVDCGMFQGSKTLKALNYGEFPFDPAHVDAALLTHAHVDHSGLLPKLVKEGFRGPIYATQPTIDLCSVMLPDSGSIQESEVATLNRRNAARGREQVSPIYTQRDAVDMMDAFRAVDYEAWISVLPGIRARYWNAGHLLGSASIEIEFANVGRSGEALRVLASGDIGPDSKLFEPGPEAPTGLDYVLCESTYGDIDRPALTSESRRAALANEVIESYKASGPLIIPAFAVERSQELISDLVLLMQRGEVISAPIFLDSPLAIRATEVFRRHSQADIRDLLSSPLLRCTESVEESKAIARFSGFHVIVAASGMCDAGRIRHHLKNWLWRPNATVLLTGFQAQGTLGRFLQEGAPSVRIQGEEVKVRARIRQIHEYSGHADGPELARWIAARRPIRRGVFLVHGEQSALEGLSGRIAERSVPTAQIFVPMLDDVYELTTVAPTPLDASHPRRLKADAVVNLDWHNDMSKLILDINAAMEAAADDRSRRVILRRLARALKSSE
jgi:metallo-beta-lactamase family protein